MSSMSRSLKPSTNLRRRSKTSRLWITCNVDGTARNGLQCKNRHTIAQTSTRNREYVMFSFNIQKREENVTIISNKRFFLVLNFATS